MSFWRRLFGLSGPKPTYDQAAKRRETPANQRPASKTLILAPASDEDDPHDIVGESHYQDALEAIAGPKTPDGADEWITAELVPEPHNPYDPNAVAVLIDGQKVGHLSRQDAPVLGQLLRSSGAALAECEGTIEGGWKRPGSEGSYCVRLDVAWPPRRDQS